MEINEVREVGTYIDNRHSTFEYRAGTNIELALTSAFGTSPEYRAGANVEPALTSTFGTCPDYRAVTNNSCNTDIQMRILQFIIVLIEPATCLPLNISLVAAV
ncbi:hypothetical protein DPMN_138015 [Dreissena polymorpha]|uniref:Uncharacterized protein n=1 Tax=Dreissena polymorpha TaxID=45954 RepID=A0A9D4G6U4_DREPO|nr:hypothetical protein DPMN_138015 [Dreissena polymorpha]